MTKFFRIRKCRKYGHVWVGDLPKRPQTMGGAFVKCVRCGIDGVWSA